MLRLRLEERSTSKRKVEISQKKTSPRKRERGKKGERDGER